MGAGAAVVGVALLPACRAESQAPDPAGASTPAATRSYTQEERALYREAVRRLARSEAGSPRAPVVLRTRAVSVKSFQDDAAEIVLERCVEVRSGAAGPVLQQVTVHRRENRTWRIGDVTTTDEPCSG